jgi:large subunit ribosomal protein L33
MDREAAGACGGRLGVTGTTPFDGNENQRRIAEGDMARNDLRPVVRLRSIAGTGYTYVTRKSRRNDPDRLTLRKYGPQAARHVEFREER